MRLDQYLSVNGFAKSRSYAAELIKKGFVNVDGRTVTKASYDVKDEKISISGEIHSFVGRGGMKLDGALTEFGIDVTGSTAIDVGASTGGFTDCLLKRGADRVIAVDSGHGQLDPVLCADSRVVNLEGFNARELSEEAIGCLCDIAVCDVSFISQTYLMEQICSVLTDNGKFVTLVKPQFECGKSALSKGGIVKEKKEHRKAIEKVIDYGRGVGFSAIGVMRSAVDGGDGNKEFLIYFTKCRTDSKITDKDIDKVIG